MGSKKGIRKGRMIQAIQADKGLDTGDLCTADKVCGHAGRCAVGALLYHAHMFGGPKISNKDLRDVDSFLSYVDMAEGPHTPTMRTREANLTAKVRKALGGIYGLTNEQVSDLIRFNDNTAGHQEEQDYVNRAKAVINFIRKEL